MQVASHSVSFKPLPVSVVPSFSFIMFNLVDVWVAVKNNAFGETSSPAICSALGSG